MKIDRFVGVDGEGVERSPHRYIYLALVDEYGARDGEASEKDLSTQACLETLLTTPLSFGYALTYDVTMWLRDLSSRQLYALARPETRRLIDESVPAPIDWYPSGVHYALRQRGEIGYRIDYIKRRLQVRDIMWTGSSSAELNRKTIVWDIFAFFQGTFVKALKDWGVGSPYQIERIEAMKKERATFKEKERTAIEAYCREECQLMAQLTRKLLSAHEEAGLPITVFFGAGSTASVMLDKLKIKKFSLPPMKDMLGAVASAFVGGHFEPSCVGPQPEAKYGYDICSAYPYAMMKLPCLTHGQWRFLTHSTAERIDKIARESTLCLVHCKTDATADNGWGILPWRSQFGEIVYPLRNPGTWVWQNEYLAARRYAEHSGCNQVTADRCWYYVTKCHCKPFLKIEEYYLLRQQWGAQGKGITLKLAYNGGYGKIAQSRGRAPYNNWIWAGCITSYTRSMLLEALTLVRKPSDIVSMATDGIISKSEIRFDYARHSGKVDALGSWKPEHSEKEWIYKDGVHIIKPGIYFPLGKHTLKNVRSRGVHRKTLLEYEAAILDSWYKHGPRPIRVGENTRFVGMLTGVYSTLDKEIRRRDVYADWVKIEVDINYDCWPKRTGIREDGSLVMPVDRYRSEGEWASLDRESAPYMRAVSEQQVEARDRMFADLVREENV